MHKKTFQKHSNAESAVSNGLTYADAGVDIDAGNALVTAIKPLARSTARAGAQGELGGFGGLFDLKAAGFADPVLVAANDGVGTKLKIAIETGIHDTVGVDLVAMCVNDLIVQGAEPLFFLDYLATGKLEVAQARSIVEGIADGCRQAGCALIGGETAEMPGMYMGGDFDLAGFAVGAAERGQLLPSGDIGVDDIVFGLPSSGLHSNGYSLVRKVIQNLGLSLDSACAFQNDQKLGEVLLEPTRIYVQPLLAAIRQTGGIKALAHVTGGGFVENVPRILPESLAASIDLSAIDVPKVFGWLAREGGIKTAEMIRTFNCGIGMIVVVAEKDADAVTKVLVESGETPVQLGALVERDDERVQFEGSLSL